MENEKPELMTLLVREHRTAAEPGGKFVGLGLVLQAADDRQQAVLLHLAPEQAEAIARSLREAVLALQPRH